MNNAESLVAPADALTVGRRRWIDLLVVIAGGCLVVAGLPLAGVPLVALGLVAPLVHRSGRRHHGEVYHLVPAGLADSHRALLAAAALPGVVDGRAVAAAADDALLECAALLAGRAPRGAAQRRFVAARERALREATDDLEQWHRAWADAKAELEQLGPALPEPEPPAPRAGAVVAVVAVALLPAFLLWDGLVLAGRALVVLVDGLALRVRTAARLCVVGVVSVAGLARQARRVWNSARAVLVSAAVEARRRASSLRLQVRLRLRRARRLARSG
ncbi:MAG TPA: hypothetical protein VFJ85_18855 [Acidimicrobiales bacterium]|nr:hypothetical protein [Acidimicrobiales bacterium]